MRCPPLREVIPRRSLSLRDRSASRGGYAGDAVLIDYIYTRSCRTTSDETVSEMGEKVFEFNRDTPACARRAAPGATWVAAADRRNLHAGGSSPKILSVACGHLREATLCRGVTGGQTGRFIALDQDRQSLDVVEQEVLHHGVVPVCNSIRSLFRGEVADERFDFIYSTGLYDYLDDRIATKLTSRLFDMLNPGGRLLVANFLPDIWGAGYMESFMDWKLIYRSAEEMEALCANIEDAQISLRRTFIERHANIVFMEVCGNNVFLGRWGGHSRIIGLRIAFRSLQLELRRQSVDVQRRDARGGGERCTRAPWRRCVYGGTSIASPIWFWTASISCVGACCTWRRCRSSYSERPALMQAYGRVLDQRSLRVL